jgi:hypothetical protein
VAHEHRLQTSRFELKYVIDERLVRPLRDFIRGHLQPDEHADVNNGCQYTVHSLYLDSPSYALCRSTIQGHKNRFKLRIRYYDDLPDSPAFFEIKRRIDDVIVKQRAVANRGAVGRILRGQWPEWSDLVHPRSADYGAMQRFCSLRDTIQADGRVFVSYMREAYVTPDNDTVRMTFDRQIACTPYAHGYSLNRTQKTLDVGIEGVVLELKFTERFPQWMGRMVRTFDLERTSMAKYVACVLCYRRRGRPVSARHGEEVHG